MTSRVDEENSIMMGRMLVGGVKGGAGAMWVRLVGTVGIVSTVCNPSEGRGGGIEHSSLGEMVREGCG